ncbi:unnamed protein product [Protopolystoma xenopodis]|uniref:Uncharacterized protein n=1 Tax=Protopolystoma xenopodis TaxID=117903 RepID=A0A3S5B407_9PLAT|nr:unnamed protein product [Protopolystoma xenopodis]
MIPCSRSKIYSRTLTALAYMDCTSKHINSSALTSPMFWILKENPYEFFKVIESLPFAFLSFRQMNFSGLCFAQRLLLSLNISGIASLGIFGGPKAVGGLA